jgi:uncharacterized membrane protein HdeD (DUF308 family)
MKILLSIVGVIMVLLGAVWILQGLNVLPGSFMTGDMKWAVIGAVVALAGIALLTFNFRRRRR